MQKEVNLENLLAGLKSDDPEILLAALDESVDLVSSISQAAVPGISNSLMGPFVAERIYLLAAAVMNDVEQFMNSSTSPSEKTHAAVVLLLLGSQAGVPHLLKVLEQEGTDSFFAANKLAQAGIVEAADGIITILRDHNFEDPLMTITMIENLEKLKVPLPNDLKNKFSAEEAHPWIRKVVTDEMPPLPALFSTQQPDRSLRA